MSRDARGIPRARGTLCPRMNLLDGLYLLLAGVTYPIWRRKKREGWRERFGHIAPVPDRAGETNRESGDAARLPRVLIHAVSVGEVSALRELIPLLTRAPRPVHVIISVGTDTGLARARELFAESCDIVRYPLDFSWAVRRFLGAVRPDAVALVELEIWPNFVKACARRHVPVGVINGRLSERSFRGYRRFRWFFRPSFRRLAFAAVQSDEYDTRFRAMGVPGGRCFVTSSMKWDSARIADDVPGSAELAREMGIARGEGAPPLIVAGSTAEDEEKLLHEACAKVGAIQLLCAPRKPEHFDEAALALPGCVRRSAANGATSASDSPSKAGVVATIGPGASGGRWSDGAVGGRFLLDTIGELRKAYALADLVVIGRSFGTLFGSDPIEPIALGKPVIIGPHVDDFAEIVRILREGRGLLQRERGELSAAIRGLLASPENRAELARRGRDVIRQHQGASKRHAEMIGGMLSARPSEPSSQAVTSPSASTP